MLIGSRFEQSSRDHSHRAELYLARPSLRAGCPAHDADDRPVYQKAALGGELKQIQRSLQAREGQHLASMASPDRHIGTA